MSSVEDPQPLISHLVELRDRLLRALGAVLLVFISLVYFANDIYAFVSAPLVAQLPAGTSMIATDVASPFFTPIKLTLVVSVFVAVPVILYQLWAFIAPGLYKHEKRLVMPLWFQALCSFIAGSRSLTLWFSHSFLDSSRPSPPRMWKSPPTLPAIWISSLRFSWHLALPLRSPLPSSCWCGRALSPPMN